MAQRSVFSTSQRSTKHSMVPSNSKRRQVLHGARRRFTATTTIAVQVIALTSQRTKWWLMVFRRFTPVPSTSRIWNDSGISRSTRSPPSFTSMFVLFTSQTRLVSWRKFPSCHASKKHVSSSQCKPSQVGVCWQWSSWKRPVHSTSAWTMDW